MILPHDDLGEGPTLVLLHAGVADRTMWSELLGPLSQAGYRVIALDLPGYGEAPLPLEQEAPWLDVAETLDALAVERVALVGNSFGGAVAQRVALLQPERLWAMALISSPDEEMEPSPELRSVWEAEEAALELEDLDGAVQIVIEAWTLPDAPARLRMRVAAMQRRALEIQIQDGETPPGPDPLELDPKALRGLKLPVLVAYGERDMVDFHGAAERLAAAIPGARTEVIAGAGHLSPLERPQAFSHLLLAFLAEVRAREGQAAR